MSFTLECMNEALDGKQLDDTADVRKLDAHAVVTRRNNVANLSGITDTVVSDVRNSAEDVSATEAVVSIVDNILRCYYEHPEIDTDLPEPDCEFWDEQIAAEIYALEHTFLKGIVTERKFHADCPADTLEPQEIKNQDDNDYTSVQQVEEDEIDAQANGVMVQVKSSESQARNVFKGDGEAAPDIAVFPSSKEPCGWRGVTNNGLTHKKRENTWEHLGMSE